MPLQNTFFDTSLANPNEMTQILLDLAHHPKQLPWGVDDASHTLTNSFDKLFDPIDCLDQFLNSYFPAKENIDTILTRYTFISLACFFESNIDANITNIYKPILETYSASIFIKDNYVDAVVENIRRLIAPGKVLILSSKNPDFINKSINDSDLVNQAMLIRGSGDEYADIDILGTYQKVSQLFLDPKYQSERNALYQNITKPYRPDYINGPDYPYVMPIFTRDMKKYVDNNFTNKEAGSRLITSFLNLIMSHHIRQIYASKKEIF